VRFVAFAIALSLPTTYVVLTNYYGFNAVTLDLSRKTSIPWADQMALSYEYLVFTVFLVAIVLLEYGMRNLGNFAISTLFSGTIGAIYTIDNLYPFGRFAPFQLIVPTTTMLAANVLSLVGYSTTLGSITNPTYGSMPYLAIRDSLGRSTGFGVAWPCSGVESLLIYTVTILLFLKNSAIPWVHRIVYFTVGAVVTYGINVMRIVTIFLISINTGGGNTLPTQEFHNYYGQLYSIIWIISYPLLIIVIQLLRNRIRI
jgi:thaumarchaeosortase